MSLFKSREFWSVQPETSEQFDINALKLHKLNSNSDYIIIGSHEGLLRIYKPSIDVQDENISCTYKPNDLCIEKNLNLPILQVDIGRLVSGSTNEQIAILHPKSFAIYGFTTKPGISDQGNQNMISLLYDHKLHRSAASFVIGPFGGTQNRDFIAVQSLDGMLSFYEQETFVFCCFIPNFLLPSPFIYSKRSDSFIICNSNYFIESYSYKILSSIGQNTGESDSSGVKFDADWSFNLSEEVTDIKYLYDVFCRESYILILSEKHLLCLTDNGKLKFMKRFEFSPCCFNTYCIGEEKLMTLIVSETNTLLVYQNTTLRWSAQLPAQPVAITRANFQNLRGVLVTLTDDGKLNCSYLGTEPNLFTAPPLINQEMNYEEAENELAVLNRIIRSTARNDIKINDKTAERELVVNIIVSPHLVDCIYEHKLALSEISKMCLVQIKILPQVIFEEVSLSVNVQRPLKVVPQSIFYQNIIESCIFECHVYMFDETEVASLEIDVAVSCVSNIGMPRVLRKTALLPMNLVAKTCSPVKESNFKITLGINENPVALATLFPEYIGIENSLTMSSTTVAFTNILEIGCPVTILSAKSSQRYRLQSDSLLSLSICVQELIRRLKTYFAAKSAFAISYNSPLPDINEYIKNHFEARHNVKELQNEVAQLGAQFRLIQKRLIAKFKDKNPTPLTNLDMLLSDTYRETLATTEALEKASHDLNVSQINLSCALQLVVSLMKIKEDIGDKRWLANVLCPFIYDLDGQDWEDTLDASLNYLLKNVFAKSDKDKLRASVENYENVKDLTKLEKHLNLILERSLKKGNIEEEKEEDIQKDESVPNAKEEEDAGEKELLPIGSQFGESSTRVLSARKSLLRKRNKIVE